LWKASMVSWHDPNQICSPKKPFTW
jgi:hypothetical protein